MNLRIILIGEVITDIGYRSVDFYFAMSLLFHVLSKAPFTEVFAERVLSGSASEGDRLED